MKEVFFDILKSAFGETRGEWEEAWDQAAASLECAFDFMEAAFITLRNGYFCIRINTDYSCVRLKHTSVSATSVTTKICCLRMQERRYENGSKNCKII